MNRAVLQIPVSATLKNEAKREAQKLGFSSLQELIRIFLNKVAAKQIDISFKEEGVVRLSPKAERRYERMLRDIKSGKEKVYTAKDVDDLMKQLNE